ncbi:L-glutaminase [Humitalea rosea]|uniref:Glutaminase n=1 Tax=Humitalea rosea TaxID=990373 RepID=A0A2W7IGM9_9PROT|nr:glutaminase A [Humitalea rosea]PZW45711.1 L-glutaminase [Humitalea rosea]
MHAPDIRHSLSSAARETHARLHGRIEGAVASYIPALAAMPPDLFGIALMTPSGAVAEAGDTRHPFTIQSVSKCFTYAMVLDLLGRDAVRAGVGVQPVGEPFNVIELDPRSNRPFNPMINSGAIAVAGLLRQTLGPDAFAMVKARLSACAGRMLEVDAAVHASEAESGHRNRAIAHLLRAAGAFTADPQEAVELYFLQCSLLVTAHDLAVMGATLAAIGTNPLSGKEVFGVDAVRDTLSVMFTCGLYDGAGDWACRVGLPAKSGVGGGVVAVVNRQLGLGVFSPRLNADGNPHRGLLACEMLAEDLGLHAFDATNSGSSLLPSLAPG